MLNEILADNRTDSTTSENWSFKENQLLFSHFQESFQTVLDEISPKDNDKAFEYIIKYLGMNEFTPVPKSQEALLLMINQFKVVHGICPYTQKFIGPSPEREKEQFNLNRLSLKTTKHLNNKQKFYESVHCQKRFAKTLDNFRITLSVCPTDFKSLFNSVNGFYLILNCADLVTLPLKERCFKKTKLAMETAFVSMIHTIAINQMWRDEFIRSTFLKDTIVKLLELAFYHHACTPYELLNASTHRDLNCQIIPSNSNVSRKIPSLRIRSQIISILNNIIMYGGSNNIGYTAVYNALRTKVSNTDNTWFDYWMFELKASTKEIWRIWKGITEKTKGLFLELEVLYLRLDSVWRTNPVYQVSYKFMEEYTALNLKFIELLLVWAAEKDEQLFIRKAILSDLRLVFGQIHACTKGNIKDLLKSILVKVLNE